MAPSVSRGVGEVRCQAGARGRPSLSVRSGGSGTSTQSRMPLSARSNVSAVSMHANSYSYLSDRSYDAVQARAIWLQRVQRQSDGRESEAVALKRLPANFDPFFTVYDQERRQGHASTNGGVVGHPSDLDQTQTEPIGCFFRVMFAIFSSRSWDRLYLVLALMWAILCPGYLDGVIIAIQRNHLAWIMLAMTFLAVAPAASTIIFKAFFSSNLRPCLQESKHSAGVCFVLATKSIPVPAIHIPRRCGTRFCGKRVYPSSSGNDEADDIEAFTGGTDVGGSDRNPSFGETRPYPGEKHGSASERSAGDKFSFTGTDRENGVAAETSVSEQSATSDGHGRERRDRRGRSATESELELPPRHWRCIVCKKVNMLPNHWDGRAGKAVHVVIKRKIVDKQAMYGAFRTTPDVPRCDKCRTPFNYYWRNGRGGDQNNGRYDPVILRNIPPHSRSATASRKEVTNPPVRTEEASSDDVSAGNADIVHSSAPPTPRLRQVKRWIRNVTKRGLLMRGQAETNGQPELWYGREFHRQLKTYFKPELPRPSLTPRAGGGAGGGRYTVGARVACFAGKEAWYPGKIEAARENYTYDVRYENGDIAQHVFPHMVRFEPTHNRDSNLVCLFYGLALGAAVSWPLAGFHCFSIEGDMPLSDRGHVVATPALVFGLAGVAAVAVQWWAIYRENPSAGLCVTARYAAVIALPPASLALVGGTAMTKASDPTVLGSWIEMLLLPAALFSLTAGGYAHAVSPAYAKAWAAASLPWLLFLLLVSLRLDGETGNASPALARVRWMGVFFPLWILLVMILAAHHVLPLVWNVEGYAEPATVPEWRGGLAERIKGAVAASISVVKRARERKEDMHSSESLPDSGVGNVKEEERWIKSIGNETHYSRSETGT